MIVSPIKFLGAYVVSVNSQIAWGGDSSTCSMTLVEDPDNGIVFTPPEVGTACKFTFGSFSFGGIYQRFTYKEDTGSGRMYDIVLESPSKVLDGVYVIFDTFQGTVYNDLNLDTPYINENITYGGKYPTNIINIFAHKENYNFGGKFGNANTNSLGYPAKNFIKDFNDTVIAAKFGGKIKYGNSEYSIDLSELKKPIDAIEDYRLQGDYLDINSIIKGIIDLSVIYDYVVTLDGDAVNELGVITDNPTIKIKVISREKDPMPNAIMDKINFYKNLPDKEKILSSYSIGKENSDNVTQKLLLGAPASRHWFADRRYIYPIWGSKGVGENTTYYFGNSIFDYSKPTTKIKAVIDGGWEGNFSTVETDLLEVRCALSGRQTWSLYHVFKAIKEGKEPIGAFGVRFSMGDFQRILNGELGPSDLENTNMKDAEILGSYFYGSNWEEVQQAKLRRLLTARFAAISRIANEFYGRKYLVAMPLENGGKENNYRWIEQDFKKEYSWDLDQSAWAGEQTKKEIKDISFYTQTGKLKPVAYYDNAKNCDYSVLQSNYARTSDPYDAVIAGIEIDYEWGMKFIDDYTFEDINDIEYKDSTGKVIPPATSLKNQIVYSVINIPEPPRLYDEITTEINGFGMLAKLMLGYTGMSYLNSFGIDQIDVPIAPAPLVPQILTVPQISNRYVWGPWYSVGADNGKVSILSDPVFAPETFGTVEEMNKQAQTYVNTELAKAYTTESGYIELAEEPKFNIGDRFLNSGPYVTSMSMSISTGGFLTTYQFATWTKRGANLAKYNIDRIAQSKQKNFEYQQKIRRLFRNPIPKPMLPLATFEKRERNPSINGVFGVFANAAARAVNGYDINTGKFPSVSVSALPTSAASSSVGINQRESFGNSMEQFYNAGFIFNQRDMQAAINSYNGV